MEFEHVDGQAVFCGQAVEIIMDYRSNKLDSLTSVETENAIITRLSEAAVKHVAPGADYNEVQRVVALAYKAHRPGPNGVGVQPILFYRVTHIRSLVFSIIDGIVPLPRGKDATPKKKTKTSVDLKEDNPAQTTMPPPLGVAGPIPGNVLDK